MSTRQIKLCNLLTSHIKIAMTFSVQKQEEIKKNPAAQAAGQILPDATPPVGKIRPFGKISVTIEPIQQFRCPSRFIISKKNGWNHHF